MQSLPQIFGKPCRNSRGNHSQDNYFHTVTPQYLVRWQIRFSGRRIYDVRSQYREITSPDPTVEHTASGFHIMITHISGIIFHVVHHLRTKMRRYRIYIIIVISCRLSLQDIAIIE